MKTLVCIEKIGGISGKRIYVRLVNNIINLFPGMFRVCFPKKSNTLFITQALLEDVLKILDHNKNLIHQEDWNFGNIDTYKGYWLMEIEYIDGKIIEIQPLSLKEGIKYADKVEGLE